MEGDLFHIRSVHLHELFIALLKQLNKYRYDDELVEQKLKEFNKLYTERLNSNGENQLGGENNEDEKYVEKKNDEKKKRKKKEESDTRYKELHDIFFPSNQVVYVSNLTLFNELKNELDEFLIKDSNKIDDKVIISIFTKLLLLSEDEDEDEGEGEKDEKEEKPKKNKLSKYLNRIITVIESNKDEPAHEPSHEPVHEPSHKPVHEPSHDPEHEPSHEPVHEPSHDEEHEPSHDEEHEPEHEQSHDHFRDDLDNSLTFSDAREQSQDGNDSRSFDSSESPSLSIPNERDKMMGGDDKLGIIEKILNDYDNDVKNNDDYADEKFIKKVELNNLDPDEKLSITLYDKAFFIGIVYLIRYVSLLLIQLLIDKNYIHNILSGIIYYTIIYTIILLILIFIINFDTYKLRSIFCYLNLNINTYGILIHIITFYIFIYLIYMLTSNLTPKTIKDYFEDYIHNNELNFNEQLKILYRLDILTIIVFVFSTILILVL